MSSTDQLAADEAQRDPATSGNETTHEPAAVEGRPDAEPRENEAKRRQGTGPHRSIRSTGTDNKPIQPVSEGVEHNTQKLKKKEPDDNLPDQLDRNK
jgi:hypothetical protein